MQNFVNRKINLAIDQLREAIDEMYEELEKTRNQKSFQDILQEIGKIGAIIYKLQEAEL